MKKTIYLYSTLGALIGLAGCSLTYNGPDDEKSNQKKQSHQKQKSKGKNSGNQNNRHRSNSNQRKWSEAEYSKWFDKHGANTIWETVQGMKLKKSKEITIKLNDSQKYDADKLIAKFILYFVDHYQSLKELDLSGNELTSIPQEIFKLKNLIKLDLRNNNLTKDHKDMLTKQSYGKVELFL